MRLIWDDSAEADFSEIIEYIADRNPQAAEKIEEAIGRTLEFLTINPFMYRRGRVLSTREAVVNPNYILIYRVDDDLIRIMRVLHARQNYP